MISVLTVDDEQSLLDISRRFLEQDPSFSVDSASSGDEALRRIASRHYDAVVSDFLMPGMDGLALLKKVRETNRMLPFILLTGKGTEDVVIEALNAGADFYLKKGGDSEALFTELSRRIRIAVEQRMKAAEFKEREALFRSFLEYSPLGIQAYRPDGEIVFWNVSSERIYGYSKEEAVGKNLGDLIIPDEVKPRFHEQLRSGALLSASGEFAPAGEVALLRKDGSTVRVHSVHLAVCTGGKAVLFYCIDLDLSEREKIERALGAANRKLNMLSSITRHDILNQIMALRTYIHLSKEETNDPVLHEYIKKEDLAAETIEWLLEVTNCYQDIGKHAATWVPVHESISSARKQLNPAADIAETDLSGVEIFADPLVEKVFYNLMENSVRHGGNVTLMRYSARETDEGLLLVYEDNGAGITPEYRQKLFQKGNGKHTGLGLFLSREILSITGIAIKEAGAPGRGARFEILIPHEHYRRITSKNTPGTP